MNIDWDSKKAEANVREHDVSFAEAATVLTDDYALTREDPDSFGEQRFVALGMSATGALLVVCHRPAYTGHFGVGINRPPGDRLDVRRSRHIPASAQSA